MRLRHANLANRWSLELDWDKDACVGWFRYTYSGGKRLDVLACEVISFPDSANDVLMKSFVQTVPVRFTSRARKTLAETCVAVSAVNGTFWGSWIYQTVSLLSRLKYSMPMLLMTFVMSAPNAAVGDLLCRAS